MLLRVTLFSLMSQSLSFSAPYYQNSASVAAAYQNMNPQQLQWMQQLYMQQMAYYMQ